jgi:hypothetical protein
MKAIKTITVKELRVFMLAELNALQDSDKVTFGGGRLSFSKVKNRGPKSGEKLVDIEFNEVYEVVADPNDS